MRRLAAAFAGPGSFLGKGAVATEDDRVEKDVEVELKDLQHLVKTRGYQYILRSWRERFRSCGQRRMVHRGLSDDHFLDGCRQEEAGGSRSKSFKPRGQKKCISTFKVITKANQSINENGKFIITRCKYKVSLGIRPKASRIDCERPHEACSSSFMEFQSSLKGKLPH